MTNSNSEGEKPRFNFSDVVVVERNLIGVVVKIWESNKVGFNYDVYVRSLNGIENYQEDKVKPYIFEKTYEKVED